MSRTAAIQTLVERIRAIGLTDGQVRVVYGLLVERRTHRDLAEEEGVTRFAMMRRINRARHLARAAGIEIPKPRPSGGRYFWRSLPKREAAA